MKAMKLFCDARANESRMKSKSLSYKEVLILFHRKTQLNSSRGIQKRMLYYIVTYFVIRNNEECYNLKYKDFTIASN